MVYHFFCLLYPIPTVSNIYFSYSKTIFNEPEWPVGLSDNFLDFIKGLLVKDQTCRLGCNGSDEVLNHPFLQVIELRGQFKYKLLGEYFTIIILSRYYLE